MNKYKFSFYAAGIFVAFFYFGIVQEKITRGKYSYEVVGEDGTKSTEYEKYTFTITLVLVQCVMNFMVAKIFAAIWHQGDDTTHILYYVGMSVTYLLAMICSNMALQWVPYPTQVIGKSAKPIPVMILGVIVGKQRYPPRKYLFIFMIVFGIVIFMLKDTVKSQTKERSVGLGVLLSVLFLIMDGLTGTTQSYKVQDYPIFLLKNKVKSLTQEESFGFGVGESLLIVSLILDGVLGVIQDRIRAESKPTGIQMMKTANGWCTFILTIAILATGEYSQFYEFAKRFPYVVPNLLMLGLTSAVGQLFLYSMVSEFGPLVVSVVTTTRKFFTVLASVILFGNAISGRQWVGAGIVFTALFLDAFYSKSAPKKK